MKRRILLAATGMAFHFRAIAAPRRVGWISLFPRRSAQATLDAVGRKLAVRGHVPGRDVEFHAVFAENEPQRLPELARALVARAPDVIVAAANAAVHEVLAATRTIPIVMAGAGSPVATGLVASLSKPGGNVTGTTWSQLELAGKLLELLHDVAPRTRRVTILWNPEVATMTQYQPFVERMARRLDIELSYVDIRKAGDLRPNAVLRTRPDALYVALDPVLLARLPEIVAFAAGHHLPSVGTLREFAAAGGLLSVTPDPTEIEDNVADCLDRILRGSRPADIPVREPSRFLATLNLRAAREMGLVIPRDAMLQASEFLE